jgi:hypothetical protein
VLKNVTKDETVQYVLALVEEMLAGAAAGLVEGICPAPPRCLWQQQGQRWGAPNVTFSLILGSCSRHASCICKAHIRARLQ